MIKTDILSLVNTLSIFKVDILSTGETQRYLERNGFKTTSIEEYTGFSEILDGRVKTLHPKIHAGILKISSNTQHRETLESLKIDEIDLVIVNLYPFLEVMQNNLSWNEGIEFIDVGGITMLRGAAKNYLHTVALSSVTDYSSFNDEFKLNKGFISQRTSLDLARKTFGLTALYDSCIANCFNKHLKIKFPEILNLSFKKDRDLRYGENPHQKASFYNSIFNLEKMKLIQGKELSFNNVLDLDVAFESCFWMGKNTVSIIKHNVPCGLAQSNTVEQSFELAFRCDPVSNFGAIVGINGLVDEILAERLMRHFLEGIIAEDFTEDALLIFSKNRNIRIMKFDNYISSFDRKFTNRGLLIQDRDLEIFKGKLEFVTIQKPTDDDINALLFAWKVAKFVKSNGIVISEQNYTLGIGNGQMSRIDAIKLAILKSELSNLSLENSYLSSDAFFPFRDSIDEIAKKNIRAIIQPRWFYQR